MDRNPDRPRDVIVVINRRSREATHAVAQLHAALREHGLQAAEFHLARDSSEVRAHVRRAVKGRADAVIVGGGDGTMAHAVDAMAYAKTRLGVVPLGTGNSFAQSLDVPLGDVAGAIALVARGNHRRVDLGRVNGTYFANFATIGLSSEIAGATSSEVKATLGPIAYVFATLMPLLRHGPFRARIRWSRGKLTLRTQDIIIANGRYFGSSPVTPDASLTSKRLHLFTTDDGSRLGALRTYLAFGRHDQTTLPGAHTVSTKKLTIVAEPRQMISIDGSLLEKTPATFRVAPRALRVYVP